MGKVLLFSREGCGTGDNDIGFSILMQLLEALPGRNDKPVAIVMWNTAVNLMTGNSPALSRLKKIEDKGVPILAGKLCVNELGIADKIAVGKIAGIDEILDVFFQNEVISL